MLGEYYEAELVVRVKITDVISNCPRYIHRMLRIQSAPHVPKDGQETPLALWKRIDMIQVALPAKDQGLAKRHGGLITMNEWVDAENQFVNPSNNSK